MTDAGDFRLPHIDALLDGSGAINIGHLPLVGQIAIASDAHHMLAMLRRRPGESLAAVLLRLDTAIALVNDNGRLIDEINA